MLARLSPHTAAQCVDDIAAMRITWAPPSAAYQSAIALATQLHHHLFDTLYHALALEPSGASFITADRRCFDKAQHLGHTIWLPEWAVLSGPTV